MTDPVGLLHAPLGQPGSGRVRYGAAMALWRAGQISAEMLEIYRIASAHDARDPVAMLRDRGLQVPQLTMKVSPLAMLYATARDYVLALNHPGAAEVRAGLPADPGPARPVDSQRNPVVEQWLEPALNEVMQTHPALATAIAMAAPDLTWITYDGYAREDIGESFASGHAYASIMGTDAPFAAQDFDLGLFLIAPHVLYRDHHHAAPELYAPLTGPHGWRFGVGRMLMTKPAHQPVWNPAHQPHLTKVGPVPFLCLFVWTKDVNDTARVLPAHDWPALEEARLG